MGTVGSFFSWCSDAVVGVGDTLVGRGSAPMALALPCAQGSWGCRRTCTHKAQGAPGDDAQALRGVLRRKTVSKVARILRQASAKARSIFSPVQTRIGHISLVHKPIAWGCIVDATLLGASRDGPCHTSPCRVRRSPRHTRRPLPQDHPKTPQVGTASWYGPGCHGQATASGETFDPHALTAAPRTLPLGTEVTVTNLDTGPSVLCTSLAFLTPDV